MSGGERHYSGGPSDSLLLRPLDGLTLVYHRPSGTTHIVDSPVPEILSILGPQPQSAAALLDRLAGDYDLEDSDEALAGLTGHLETLCALGLARPV